MARSPEANSGHSVGSISGFSPISLDSLDLEPQSAQKRRHERDSRTKRESVILDSHYAPEPQEDTEPERSPDELEQLDLSVAQRPDRAVHSQNFHTDSEMTTIARAIAPNPKIRSTA